MGKHYYEVTNETFEYLVDALKAQSRSVHVTGIRPQIMEHFEDGTSALMPLESPKNFIGTASDEPARLAAEAWYQ